MTKISWDKYSLKIDEKSLFLIGGEFHYWRVPDRERWYDILKIYKSSGLNCVRIYFHWGYHNPNEDKFYFSGNRDVDYLLKLCEEIGLYVFVAAGPYICAETSGGGFPGWLLAKRNIRLKHLKRSFKTKYDPNYLKYCIDWYKHFIPHIIPHQITNNPKGCVIGFQIENEYFEKFLIYKGSRKYMKELIKCAQELGVDVLLYHNDAWERGAWLDLFGTYGFDKYPIWAPKIIDQLPIPEWDIEIFKKKVDHLENKTRSFGKAASEAPIFVPELQGGWYNHWGIKYGFDELYEFYGSTYQKMLLQSIAAQGSTMMSLYMFYGGTTWGSLANPEVYTSYDYSASLREFGYQSDRLRFLRLYCLFVKSFEESFSNTDLIEIPTIQCSESDILYRQRKGKDGTDYFFFRNFNSDRKSKFKINLLNSIESPKKGEIELEFKDSFIGIANHDLGGFFVIFCSYPIILKSIFNNNLLIVVIQNGGELILKGTKFETKGTAQIDVEKDICRIIFPNNELNCIINSEGKKLYLICLSKKDALSLNADLNGLNLKIAWGAYSLFFNDKNQLELETIGSQTVWLLNSQPYVVGFENLKDETIPGLKKGVFGKSIEIPKVKFEKWYKLKTDWDTNTDLKIWKEINFETERNPLDHCYINGHVLYKCKFEINKEKRLKLRLNTRHKSAIWTNGQFIGGHYNYKTKLLKAGSMNGPDFKRFSSIKYDLTIAIKPGKNELFIITESLGQNKQVFILNDARKPRGIISAKFSKRLSSQKWYISGTDNTKLEQPFNSSGLPGEIYLFQKGEGNDWLEINDEPKISPKDQISWYKTQFKWKIDNSKRIPLKIHLEGQHNVNVFLNGLYIGRYWGELGPQHDFYIMDGILKENNHLVLACWTTKEDNFSIAIKPYKIKNESGNIDENGIVFATEKKVITLQ